MKFLKLFALLLISISSFGQKYYSNVVTPLHWHDGKFDTLHIPYADTVVSGDRSAGQVVLKPSDKVIYAWDGSKWFAIASTGSGGGGGGTYTLPQATATVLGGIKYNTDFYIDANGRLGIDTAKKNLWNQIALLPFYSTTAQMRGEIRDSLTNHDLTFNPTWFNRDGNYIDFISPPFIEKDSIFTNSPAASLTADNLRDINDITDTSIHPTTTYVRSLFGAIKKDTILFNRAHFYKDADSVVGLRIRSINGIKLYGDTSNINIAGGTGTRINLTTNGSTGPSTLDTVTNTLNVPNYFYATNNSDSIDYSFSAMTTIYNEKGPGEAILTANGLSINGDNLVNPFRQLKALDVGGWSSGNYVSFSWSTTKNSTAYTFLRGFLRLKQTVPIIQSISFQFFNAGTAVSQVLSAVNYGLDKSKVDVYQNITIPMNAFNFTSNSFDEVRLIFGGGSSASGLYLDLFQFQNATVNENVYLTDVFRKASTDSVFKVLGGQNVYAMSLNAAGTGSGWGLTGNSVNQTAFLGTTNNLSLKFIANNDQKMRLDSVGANINLQATGSNSLINLNAGASAAPYIQLAQTGTVDARMYARAAQTIGTAQVQGGLGLFQTGSVSPGGLVAGSLGSTSGYIVSTNTGGDAQVQIASPSGFNNVLHYRESGVNDRANVGFAAGSTTYQIRLNPGTGTLMNTGTLGLEVSQNGVTFQKLTTTQRDALTGLTEGVTIYNTTTHQNETYNGTTWAH